MRSNTVLESSESRLLGAISTSSIRNLLQRSVVNAAKQQQQKKTKKMKESLNPRSDGENVPPPDPNIFHDYAVGSPKKGEVMKVESMGKEVRDCEQTVSDPAVKVVVRIRPCNIHEKEGERTVRKLAKDKLCVGDRSFSFDSVFDSKSNQDEIFQSVGVSVVKNALDGYNTSILSYGQTGTGKTYTMWGPPSAMVQDPSPSSHQGIVPRIFQLLFSEIQKAEEQSEDKLMNYQCRCSFLEIYNEKIGDLLDPTQRNLQVRDDTKNGIYVENLSEEYVTSYEDVTQILIKGLSSRRVGATSLNSKSSRSHIVFTFIVESWCKGTSSNCFSSSRTSRITLVDLAALDNHKSDDDGNRQFVREGKAVKKSLSQLGYLVNILANGAQSKKSDDIPYEGSCLTQLLREPLGGNSKLSIVCTISQDSKSISETLSTLRFGQRAKLIQNDPVVNEITEDDVNDISDQIRLLKEELIRAKSSTNGSNSNPGSFGGHSVRDSLNQLRLSISRSLLLPHIDADHEEELNINENDLKELRMQLDKLQSSNDENSEYFDCRRHCHSLSERISCDADFTNDFESCADESETEEVEMSKPHSKDLSVTMNVPDFSRSVSSSFRSSLSICSRSSVLQDPPLSESPRIRNVQRKSFSASSSNFIKSVSESLTFNQGVSRQSLNPSDQIRSSLRSSKIFQGPTENLAASLHRGLQIIDSHQQNLASESSTVSFSFGHLALKSCAAHDDDTAQTSPEKFTSYLCMSCRKIVHSNTNEADNSLDIIPTSEMQEAIKGRAELENVCKEQATQIEQLKHLLLQVEQYKHNTETALTSTSSLNSPKNEILLLSEGNNNSSQTGASEDIAKEKSDIQEALEVFGPNKEELVKEIESLKSKLKSYTEAGPRMSTDKLRASLLSRSIHLRKSNLGSETSNNEELEKERQKWLETESEWILLTDELRVDIEAYRTRAEKAEMELKLEKKCSEELNEVIQRAVLGHGRMVEHYAELQEKHNELVEKHKRIMIGVSDIQRAVTKAGKRGHGSRAAKYLAAELSSQRAEREKEREFLKKENKNLKIQLRDTAEALHAAGEVLVRLREAEQSASASEENYNEVLRENEKLKKQLEKVKRKHKMEMVTMKQYLAESRLPQSALQPLYQEETGTAFSHQRSPSHIIPEADDDQSWRSEFGPIYQDHH